MWLREKEKKEEAIVVFLEHDCLEGSGKKQEKKRENWVCWFKGNCDDALSFPFPLVLSFEQYCSLTTLLKL